MTFDFYIFDFWLLQYDFWFKHIWLLTSTYSTFYFYIFDFCIPTWTSSWCKSGFVSLPLNSYFSYFCCFGHSWRDPFIICSLSPLGIILAFVCMQWPGFNLDTVKYYPSPCQSFNKPRNDPCLLQIFRASPLWSLEHLYEHNKLHAHFDRKLFYL